MMMLVFSAVLFLFGEATALNNGVGLTPPMGFKFYNYYKHTVTQEIIKDSANIVVARGLDRLGYKYINVDDCWAGRRASNGSIVPDLTAFPGLPGLIDYVHSIGLKFGIYSDAGEKTFYGRPGSLNHEISDANSYAKWDVDYLKYDNYNNLPFTRYAVMRDALNKTGHPIFYSISNFGKIDSVPNVANSWRTSRDEIDFWDTMVSKADANNEWWRLAKPGAWNDPGMLEVGIAEMTNTEYEAHFSLWALMKAPLIIGCEISNMFDEIFRIITNPEVIAVNQDKLGAQGFKFKLDGDKELWGCPLDDGAVAALFLNRGNETATFKIQWSDLFLENNVTTAAVRDLWGHQNLGTFDGTLYAVAPSHGVAMFRITPVN